MTFEALLTDTIYKYTVVSSQNELGEWTMSFSSSGSLDARVMPLTDEERMVYAGRYPNVILKIYVDYDNAVKPGDRLIYDGVDYYVNEVVWDSSHTYKKIIASRL